MHLHNYLESRGALRPVSHSSLGRFLEFPVKAFLVLSGVGIVNGMWWGFDEGFLSSVAQFYGIRWVFMGGLAAALGCIFQGLGLLWRSSSSRLLHVAALFIATVSCLATVGAIGPLYELLYSDLHWQSPGLLGHSIPPIAASVSAWLYLRSFPRTVEPSST